VLLSPAVGEQLQVDACGRRIDICVSGSNSIDFSSLQVVLSGKEVIVQKSHQKSFILLSQHLLNAGLERLFYDSWSDSSSIDAAVTLSSDFAAHFAATLISDTDGNVFGGWKSQEFEHNTLSHKLLRLPFCFPPSFRISMTLYPAILSF
jgi:hypothetical protein